MAPVFTYWVTAGIVRDHLSDPKGDRHNALKCISLYQKQY